MTGMRTARRIFVLAAAMAAASCGDVTRDSRAPVLIVVDSLFAQPGGSTSAQSGATTLFSDVQRLVTSPAPCSTTSPCATVFNDSVQVTMHLEPKDIGVTGSFIPPSSNNQVTIRRYHVSFRRADGRNTEGVDVPFAFDGTLS